MEVPVGPTAVMMKSYAFTPVTGSLKVTVKATVLAVVGLGPARTIETTDGGSVSIT